MEVADRASKLDLPLLFLEFEDHKRGISDKKYVYKFIQFCSKSFKGFIFNPIGELKDILFLSIFKIFKPFSDNRAKLGLGKWGF